MRSLTKKFVEFVKKEDGPTAVEYAVMLALIIVVCIAAITTLGSNANNTFSNVAANATPSGSEPAGRRSTRGRGRPPRPRSFHRPGRPYLGAGEPATPTGPDQGVLMSKYRPTEEGRAADARLDKMTRRPTSGPRSAASSARSGRSRSARPWTTAAACRAGTTPNAADEPRPASPLRPAGRVGLCPVVYNGPASGAAGPFRVAGRSFPGIRSPRPPRSG